MSQEHVVTQRKFGARSQFQFQADRLGCAFRDHSGELQFSVPYEAIDVLDSSTLVSNNLRLFRIISIASLFVILVLSGVTHVGGFRSAGMTAIIGVWVIAIILVRFLGLLAIRYTLLPVPSAPGKRIRIIAGRNHDAILNEIKTRWRARLRELHGSVNFGNDAEKEIARFAWLKQHAVITADEFQAVVERLRTYAAHNRPQSTEQRLN